VGIMSASPLVHGLLSDRGTVFSEHPAPPAYREAVKKAAEIARSRGVDLAQLAVQYALQSDDVTSTMVGITSAAEIERNVRWALQPVDASLVEEVRSVLKPIHNYNWHVGRPENDDDS